MDSRGYRMDLEGEVIPGRKLFLYHEAVELAEGTDL